MDRLALRRIPLYPSANETSGTYLLENKLYPTFYDNYDKKEKRYIFVPEIPSAIGNFHFKKRSKGGGIR